MSEQNKCPTPSCPRSKPHEKAFCLPCWRKLPHDVQAQVWRSYRDRDILVHFGFLLRLGHRIDAGVGPWPKP